MRLIPTTEHMTALQLLLCRNAKVGGGTDYFEVSVFLLFSYLLFMETRRVSKMMCPVVSQKPILEVFLSKDGAQRQNVFVFGNKIVKKKTLSWQRSKTQRATQRGLSQSKPYTGNKPQGSYTNGNNNLTYQVNYYGHDYASASSGATTQMDPSAFTKPMADILAGPALKSPTVEECGYSDRIVQLTMGNSTITTQEAANAVVAYGEWPEFCDGLGEAIDRSTVPGPAVDRFYTLDSISWTQSFPGACYRFPLCLSELGMFGQNVQYHYLMRSGFIVHVQANATKFHQGMLMVVAIPECEFEDSTANPPVDGLTDFYQVNDKWNRLYPRFQLTLFPHQFINLRTNNSATLVLPYVSNCPMENVLSHSYWTIAIIPVVNLSYASGSSTNVPITVSAAPMYAQFNGLRAPVTQGVMTAQTPGSGQFVTTIHNSGFPVYPEFESTHGQHIPGMVSNLLQVARVDTMVNFSTSGGPTNQLLLTSSSAAGSNILTWEMDLTQRWAEPTYLGRLAKWFVNYRGSLKLTFVFCGSAMHTAKILICYTPPGVAAPTTRKDAMLGTHIVWDIGLQSSATLVVPWISQTQYRYTEVDNKFSMSGYITMWYQTALVNPAGVNNSAYIVGFLSASDDFQFRIPTDNAYFQGLNSELGRDITGHTEKQIEDVTSMKPGSGDTPSVTTGESAALTAVETGATGGAEANLLMETRLTKPSFSGMASDVSNFMAKYALIYENSSHFGRWQSSGGVYEGNAFNVALSLDTLEATAALRTKFEMFTYTRFSLDVVIIMDAYPTSKSGETDNIIQQGTFNFQALYCPPGLQLPPLTMQEMATNDKRWYMPTTPSVYFKNDQPPATMRIPFISVASAYAVFYDGYANFDSTANYGDFPGNGLGNICIRPLWRPETANVGAIRCTVRVFAKPMQFQAWIPRPIRPNNTGTTRRIMAMNVMPKRNHSSRRPRRQVTPNWIKKVMEQLPILHTQSGGMHVIPIADDKVILPLHWYVADRLPLQLLWVDDKHDLVCCRMYTNDQPKLCDCTEAYYTCNRAMFGRSIKYESSSWTSVIDVDSETVGPHEQEDLISCKGEIPFGWCGSPLFCKHGICGIATAATSDESHFTHLASVDKITILPEPSKWSSIGNVAEADEQGPCDWAAGIAEQLGSAFGGGFTDKVSQQVRETVKKIPNPSDGMTKKCISMLVKAICGAVLISKSYDASATAACVGVMLGIDLLVESPFDWLKKELRKILGIREPEEQGFVDWVKDFNACATAAKSLDWIGEKIQKFIEWIRKLFEKESPARKRFNEQLHRLPDLMKSIDRALANRGLFSDEQLLRLIQNMETLKLGAEVYGVERNFATTQIVRYYNKCQELRKSLASNRVEPVAVCFHGTPGSGKSLCTQILGRALCEHHAGKIYSLPPDPKHFDGYAGQPVVIMDDICQNPDGEDMKLFCQMVSTTEFYPPLASLEDKGTPFKSKFVLCSTNQGMLTPPTVAEPEAIARRMFIDCDIHIAKEYKVAGKLDAAAALKPCKDHVPTVFRKCCPLICGRAVNFRARNSTVTYTLDQIASEVLRERAKRETTGDLLEQLFAVEQGPSLDEGQCPDCPQGICPKGQSKLHHAKMIPDPEEWLQSEWDEESCVLLTMEEQKKAGLVKEQPCPKEIADLLRAVPNQEVIDYCISQGWVIPDKQKYKLVRESVWTWTNRVAGVLSILAAVSSIAGTIYLLYRLFADNQGPYSGTQPKQTLRAPVPRVVVQGPSCDYAQSILRKSLFETNLKNGPFTAVGLFNNWLCLPRHAEVGDEIQLDGTPFKVIDQVFLETAEGELELQCLKINRPINFPDLRPKLLTKMEDVNDCWLSVNAGHFKGMVCPVGKLKRWGRLVLSGRNTTRTAMYSYPTKSGQCGGLVTSCGKVIAMHVGGDGTRGYGTYLLRHYFDGLDKATEQGHIVEQKPSKVQIHHSTKSKLRQSVWHDVVPGSKEPAALSQKDPRLEVDLVSAMFSKYSQNEEEIEITPHMKEAAKYYAAKVKPILPDNVTDQISLEEAAYGMENLEGLDLNTSAGYPYVTMGIKKTQILDKETRDTTKLQRVLDEYGVDLPFVTYLKDELRPIAKVKAGKTRLIECSSMNDTIRMKLTFGRLFATYHQNPGPATGSAVGCNPDIHWTKFRAEMEGEIVAFDYSNFDASLNKCWFECLKIVLKEFGFSDMRPIDHIIRSRHLYKGEEYVVEGGMPSGCSGTSIFNSIINNIIIMTLVLDAYKGIDLDQLRILAYGDDVIVTYPYALDASLLAGCGKKYGLKMTPPDKSAEFKSLTWDDVTFLKRGFKPDARYPFLIHPTFDLNEIFESLRWTRDPAHTQEHVRSLAELAWHSGREEYQKFLDTVNLTNVGKACILPPYETFDRMWLDSF
ncbi:polyprotein [rabovirus C1]|uniref:Genome polyprotein n=1 Tax=rabovirus C1 TaxID=2773291 RepID=A0A2R4N9G3_9PICO|nr:polyprotein [Marmot sapelovirus 1]AVX29479.1 polyprotein [rabovirus C1]